MRIFTLLLFVVSTLLLSATAQEDCKDVNEHCKSWAASGECDKNPEYMKKECQRSCGACLVDPELYTLGKERVILEVQMPPGKDTDEQMIQEIELGFFPKAAPKTVAHIINLFQQGCYDTNHIFRLQKGFVAEIHGVHPQATTTPLSSICQDQARKHVPGEFTAIPHKRGILSMGRHDNDPDSGGSTFSMLLGDAPHMDNKYTVFGKVIAGDDDVLAELEKVETRKDGVHVVPIERITIVEAYVVNVDSEEDGEEEEEEEDGSWGQEEEEL